MKKFLLLSILILPGVVSAQIEGYQHFDIHGFQVYVSDSAIVINDSTTQEAISLLTSKLKEIDDFGLRSDIIDSLKTVSFFVEWNSAYSAAMYHPSREWLVENGYIPEKAKSIEISNVQNFIDWTALNQPYMVLHELAHAYHHKVLSFEYQLIIRAYEEAMGQSLYSSVSLHKGNGEYIKASAYAATNKLEYFAELTEAFFGKNDFFPFTKAELKEYDPKAYEVLKRIWQFAHN